MQIVIDIDEDYFEIIKHDVAQGNDYKPFKLIATGTILPKGHGRLIDADAVLEEPIGDTYKDIDIAETIVEADTESEE